MIPNTIKKKRPPKGIRYKKRGYMKDIIKGILEEYANNEANLQSEALREQLTEDIVKALKSDSRDIAIEGILYG